EEYRLLQSKERDAMPPVNPLNQLSGAFEKYQALLNDVQAQAPAGPARDELQAALEQMKTSLAQLTTELGKQTELQGAELQAAREKVDAARKKMEEAARVRKEAEIKKAAQKEAKRQPPPLDPHLAEQLRSQLLDELGLARPGAAPAAEKEW